MGEAGHLSLIQPEDLVTRPQYTRFRRWAILIDLVNSYGPLQYRHVKKQSFTSYFTHLFYMLQNDFEIYLNSVLFSHFVEAA